MTIRSSNTLPVTGQAVGHQRLTLPDGDARTVNLGHTVRYHSVAPAIAMTEPFKPDIADRLIDILDDARARGVVPDGEHRRLRTAIERRTAVVR